MMMNYLASGKAEKIWKMWNNTSGICGNIINIQ
jgi:hypothetical protein